MRQKSDKEKLSKRFDVASANQIAVCIRQLRDAEADLVGEEAPDGRLELKPPGGGTHTGTRRIVRFYC